MAIIQSLREAGYDPYFYDIDGLRPSFEEVERFFAERKPDVLGISAVVSTAYGYTKQLVSMVRRVSPKTRFVLGGNMAASAELLHRLVGIDVCVIGEGETVVVNLMKVLEADAGRLDYEALARVRGLSFLRPDGEMAATGYEISLPAAEVFDPDFTILERYSKISNFIGEPHERHDFSLDARTHEPKRKGKKMTTLVTAKGCVARCTFCHRWDKGYRTIPVEQITAKIKMLQERYNVGFITFSDENFGSDRRQTEALIASLKELDVLWQVGGVRVRSVDPALLTRMKDAGCVAVYYGMETGSPRILEFMEKKATLQNNLDAARWSREAGIFTIFQMVVGMPGETPQTIAETTEFLKTVTQDIPEPPRSLMSINYIQALPGTPVYEFARLRGLIGKTILDEERYLLSISDISAQDDTKTLNFTDYDHLTMRSWRRKIVLEVMRHYYRHNGVRAPSFLSFCAKIVREKIFKRSGTASVSARTDKAIEDYSKGGYFNLSRDLGYDVIVAYFYPMRHLILAFWLIQDEFRRLPLGDFLKDVGDWMRHRLTPQASAIPTSSLRKVVTDMTPPPVTPTEVAMQPMRDGR
jgi:radical SAM superfamily enzyme YgiQ (UPF0313 family)